MTEIDTAQGNPQAISTRKLSLAEKLQNHPRQFLLLFTVVYFIAEFCSTIHRPFFFDELCMYYIAEVPSVRQIWQLIGRGMELNPPLPFWLTWMVHHSLGKGEFLSRLPSIIGYWAMCICLYHFVRRCSDRLHGFIALLLPLFTFVHWFGTCARGYGLLLGFSAGALLTWQLAGDQSRRKLGLIGIALCIAGAVSSHYYAVYVVAALAAGEAIRTIARKQIDLVVWISIAVGCSPLIIYRQLIRTASASMHSFWVRSSPQFLYDAYAGLFGPTAMLFLAFLALIIPLPEIRNNSSALAKTFKREDLIVCVALAAMPLTFFVLSVVSPVPFYTRYVLPVVIGFTVLVVLFLYRVGGANDRFRKISVHLLIYCCFLPWAGWHVLMYFIQDPYKAVLGGTRVPVELEPSLPLVVEDIDSFLMLYFYSPENVKHRLFTLDQSDAALKYLGSDVGSHSIEQLQGIHDVHLLPYESFISSHREFLVARALPEGWVLQKLIEDGADVQLVTVKRNFGYFVEDTLVFHVKIKQVAGKQSLDPSTAPRGTEVPQS